MGHNVRDFIRKAVRNNRILSKAVIFIRWREHRVSYGTKNPSIQFYVIRRHDTHAGLFSFLMTNLGAIDQAVERGYIPVIDMMNYENTLLLPEQVGKHNAWDDYFEQPFQYSLAEAFQSRKVILGSIGQPEKFPDFEMLNDESMIEFWRKSAQKYLHIKPKIQNKINDIYMSFFGNSKVLGVLCRGTDYLILKPHDHPVQPDPEEIIRKCRKVFDEQNCEYIYLATEDENIWRQFCTAFGERVRGYQSKRYVMTRKEYLSNMLDLSQTPYERNCEYLISIGLLAKCNCLVAGATSGTYGALVLSEGYEYQYIYQLGRYE